MENKLVAKIESDYINAYKSRDELKISVLRLIKSAIKNEEINKKAELSEEAVIVVLKRELKQRKDAIAIYSQAGKTKAIQKEESEIALIESYLPKQLNESDTEKIVLDIKNDLQIKDKSQIGKLIGAVMSKHKNSVDGNLVSKIANKLLQEN